MIVRLQTLLLELIWVDVSETLLNLASMIIA